MQFKPCNLELFKVFIWVADLLDNTVETSVEIIKINTHILKVKVLWSVTTSKHFDTHTFINI